MKTVMFKIDDHNIAHIVLDRPNASANFIDATFVNDFADVVDQVLVSGAKGILLRSEKETFVAGGDLDTLYRAGPNEARQVFDMVTLLKRSLRQLETCGRPVVACISGAALGGGLEVALAAHARIVTAERTLLGQPEVTLGLLPGGGGTVRLTRLLGVQAAMPYLIEGKQFKPAEGVKLGLVTEIVDSKEQLIPAARAWIEANPNPVQPYDQKGYKVPGGTPSNPQLAQMLAIGPAMLRAKTKGVFPAPESILCVMAESLQVDIDTAMRIESRYFVELVCGQISKNMIGTFWFQLNEIKAGARRPKGIAPRPVRKIGILGAGMMGAGIAWSCASKGFDVVLKDVSLEAAEKGKSYSAKLIEKAAKKGKMTAEKGEGILARILATDNASDLNGCELVIEAVFEDRVLKARVTQEAEAHLAASAVFASNTSTLPITSLAEASQRPAQFIGLHFFSPVDKMPLVEIICGKKTDDATLAYAYDFVLQIGKTPIVVNDSRGFFTSRVFGTYTHEGMAMLGEGIPAAAIENAAFLAGFPVGPLAVTDEVSLTLIDKIRRAAQKDLEAAGEIYHAHPAEQVLDRMLEADRPGKAAGRGFYDYGDPGKKHLWTGLKELFGDSTAFELQDLKDRLLYIQALETLRCYDEKVLTSVRDANIGSIFGIGYPAWTGGALQFINQTGLTEFVRRADDLAERFGTRFKVPESLRERARSQTKFND